MELFGAYKQLDPRSASSARAQKIWEDTTYHDGCRYRVGMLWADDRSSSPKNYFSVQLKSHERRLVKNPEQNTSYSQTITKDLKKSYLAKEDCFIIDSPREWKLPHHPIFEASRQVLEKMKRNNFNSDLVPSEPEKQEATVITAIVGNSALTFVWQKYSSYEKLLRVVAYMLRSLPTFACNWTETGSNTDPTVRTVVEPYNKMVFTVQSWPQNRRLCLDCGTS